MNVHSRIYVGWAVMFFLVFRICQASVIIHENQRVQGTIEKGKCEEFALSTTTNWKYYQFTFTVLKQEENETVENTYDLGDQSTPIAQVELSCLQIEKKRYQSIYF